MGVVNHVLGLVCTATCLAAAAPLAAQCPDGSAPPCGRAAPRAPALNSVAVLYLDNLSRDTADAFLADGLTEEIIIRLGQVPRLEVRSRFEVQRFRGRAGGQDPPLLGRTLNAVYLVSGSVQRAGDQVRLRVALVRAATRAQVWGDVFDRTNRNLLTVESDIAEAVATAITGQLLPEERRRLARPLTADPMAYEDYIRGTVLEDNTFDEGGQRRAIDLFNRAIERDSAFGAAYAALSDAWSNLADGYITPRDGYTRARDAARMALARDSSLGLAYALLSASNIALDQNAAEAEALCRRGLVVDPRNSLLHVALSQALVAAGRLAQGIDEARQAWELDTLISYTGRWYARLLLDGHQLDTATVLLARMRTVLPPAVTRLIDGELLAARGDLRSAEPLLNWRYYGGLAAGTYVRALLARGDTAAARAVVDSMLAARTPGYFNPVALAKAYAALGDLDRGMEWLQRAFEERTLWLVRVRVDEELAPLRADPRYAALDRLLRF